MEEPRLEVVVDPSESTACEEHRASPDPEDDCPPTEREQIASPVDPITSEESPQPQKDLSASTQACPVVRPPSTQPHKKTPRRAPYDPNDFTSDELDPAFEWPRELPRARKLRSRIPAGAEVALLKITLRQFPLGLRLEKLVSLMWKEHNVHLWNLSLEWGYKDILRFLARVPRVRLSISKGGAHYIVSIV